MLLKKYRIELALFAAIFLIALTKRLPGPLQGIFAFNYDQGRDFLAVARIIYEKDLVLIGQTTGIAGLFYGPWWYYFLTPFFVLASGDPQKVAIIFSILGSLSIVGIYFFLKVITKNWKIAVSLAIASALSSNWMLAGVFLWNPTLTPLLLALFIFYIFRIFKTKKNIYYFAAGLFGLLIADTTASFGVFLTIFLLLHPIIFRKYFMSYKFLLTLLGALLIASPRLIFEFKNNFLMTRAIVAHLKISSQGLSISDRFINRLEQFFLIFNESFAKKSVLLGSILLILISLLIIIFIFKKKIRNKILSDELLKYTSLLLAGSFLFFVLTPIAVWDYYLVGLPILCLVILGKILGYTYEIIPNKKYILLLLIILPLLNITKQIFPPYKINWQGDDGTYKNIKLVTDYIASQKENNYSLHSYSASIFDYPIDYTISWYNRKGLLEKPKKDQDIMFLVIREASENWYIKTGWYLDKTHDRTEVVSEKSFPGDIKVEKHVRLR